MCTVIWKYFHHKTDKKTEEITDGKTVVKTDEETEKDI